MLRRRCTYRLNFGVPFGEYKDLIIDADDQWQAHLTGVAMIGLATPSGEVLKELKPVERSHKEPNVDAVRTDFWEQVIAKAAKTTKAVYERPIIYKGKISGLKFKDKDKKSEDK